VAVATWEHFQLPVHLVTKWVKGRAVSVESSKHEKAFSHDGN